MENIPDQKLIADYLKGNQKSLEILIQRYLKPVYGFVYRYVGNAQETQDIVQEVFVRVWRNLKKPVLGWQRGFNPKKGTFKTWLFSIAKNASIDFLRKKKNIPFSAFENEQGQNVLVQTVADPAPLPPEIIDRQNLSQQVANAINRLSPPYKTVLLSHYNNHFTFREIAQTLDEPLNTIKSRHRRALIALKKLLVKSP